MAAIGSNREGRFIAADNWGRSQPLVSFNLDVGVFNGIIPIGSFLSCQANFAIYYSSGQVVSMQHNHANLTGLSTPALIVDEAKMMRNIERLADRFEGTGVALRPHLKTVKSIEISRRLLAGGQGPATVSTLLEAQRFAAAGIRDIIYAVGISPQKLAQVAAIRQTGCNLSVILDSVEQAVAVADASQHSEMAIPALIEIDCDGHRGGVGPSDPVLTEIGKFCTQQGELRGVLTMR